MTEKVGGVLLDLSEYSGSDMYSEGEAEDRLLELVSESEPGDYNHLILARPGWSFLYHLSDIRGNIVDFLPMGPSDKVLEVGSGCGAITGTLSKKAGSVTCVELSKKRSLINANRNRDRDNIEIKVGNFQDIEKKLPRDYDYILLIGVFEYGASYIDAPDPYTAFLDILLGHLKKGGRLVIAIENKYGLKYFSGCREDHLGTFYGGIEGYDRQDGVRTFSRDALISMAKAAGCDVREYYPFPDYKLPFTVFSDKRLPARGELGGRSLNFDDSRIIAFDEGKAFDELIADGVFPFFSNSFLFELTKTGENSKDTRVVYSKHSNERCASYAIRTDIEESPDGKRRVIKYPLTQKAAAHIESLEQKYRSLSEAFKGKGFVPNRYEKVPGGACFEYLEGDTLEDILSKHLKRGEDDKALSLIDEYCSRIRSLCDENGMMCPADVDLIFSNIIPEGDQWTVLDYEWTFDEEMEGSYIIYRAFRYFISDCPEAEKLRLYERIGLDEGSISGFEEREGAFQRMVSGDRLSLITFDSIFGRQAYPLELMMNMVEKYGRLDRIKLYFDKGNGFDENDSCYFNGSISDINKVRFNIPIPQGLRSLRIDPGDDPCMVKLLSASVREAKVNGIAINNDTVFYKEPDPQMIFDTGDYKEALFNIEYRIGFADSGFFDDLVFLAGKAEKKQGVSIKGILGRREPYDTIRI